MITVWQYCLYRHGNRLPYLLIVYVDI